MARLTWFCLVLKVFIFVMVTEASLSRPSVHLPDWKPNAEYITKCDFDNDQSPYCDWSAQGLIRSQEGHEQFYISSDPNSPVAWLTSEVLNLSGDSCLEFWYYKPGHDSSELKVLLSDDALQTQIWSSLHTKGNTWRQVLIPLSYSKIPVKIIFELTQKQGMEEIIFDRIGIQHGQCDSKCQPDTQFWTDESTQCTCTESQLSCAQIACEDGQSCSKTVQSKGSGDSFTGTCKVMNDLRYTTFDGVKSRFMGHYCSQVLTEMCDEAGLLPDFVVKVKSEKMGKSSKLQIQQVNLNIQSLRVTLLRRNKRKIMVNGIYRNLPFSLDKDRIKISARGSALVLQTKFKLSVSFKSDALEVTVPIQYSDKLCGMCGNFNNLTDDDKNMPGSYLVKDTQILGQKWKSASSPCQQPTVPSTCSEAEKLKYESQKYCGVLLSQDGPFSKCSSSLDTSIFFRSCILEMCTTKGDREAFCEVLQAIEKSCSEIGYSVTGWRNATQCSLACGSNSHFNACSRACPATCSVLDVAEDCGECQEICDCDDSFLLSGGKCVPMKDCGCWMDGQHYEKGETFMESDCQRLCTCAGQDNIQCSATSCLAHEVCAVRNGAIGCFPSSPVTCSVYGDPHYITFDGKAYSFQGTCNYTIAKTCNSGAFNFTLTARNEGLRNVSSSLNSVALNVDGLHLQIKKDKLVYANGKQITLPFSHGSSVSVSETGLYVVVETNFGLRLLFNGNDRLFVQVDERYKGRICGLCGTYSGSQFDDFLTPDGTVVPYPHDFANSWNTHDNDWPCIDGSMNKPECPHELETAGFKECSKLFGDAFKACHWFVPPQIFVNSCVHDYCISGGDQSQLCTSLQNYVAACQVSEVYLENWWMGTVCAVPTTPPTVEPNTPTPSQNTTTDPTASCSWSCNFDQDECGWEQLIQDSFNWTRWSGSTPTSFTGPTSDHTTGSGFYMYIEGDGVYHGDSARMISTACNTLGTQCIAFWYHMYGLASSMMLNVYLLEENRATKIWSATNNQGNQWKLAQIDINPIGPFRIIVEGIRGSNAQSDVAWDDVTIVHGECGQSSVMPESEIPSPTSEDLSITTNDIIIEPTPVIPTPVCNFDCNFDNNLCTWKQLLTDVFDWTRHSGPTSTAMTGPSSDHTTGTGYYMYIEGDSASHGDTARLISEECSDVQPQCLEFWYHMYGSSSTMGLTVYLVHGNEAQEVWRKRENQGNTWQKAAVNITPQGRFRILFEGRIGDNAMSDVAFDDISIHRGQCADIITAPTPALHTPVCMFDCNFDNNFCTWKQLLTDVFDWTRHSGPTSTAMTGPSSDHTTGTGFYMYIEGDSAAHGDTARLISEKCSDVQPQCLEFWYHMYGSSWTMGLTVYLVHGNEAQEVWRMRENQGNTWQKAAVNITPHGEFKILFEGRRGASAMSDVAFDDISIHRGQCADILPRQIPVLQTPVCMFDCNFDNSLCTWKQLLTDVFDWTRHSGPTSTAMTGPSSDHTTGTGYYMYIEGDSASHGDTARLMSEECSDVQPQCLQFWYHMYGSSSTMGLTVYLLHGNEAQEVWRKRENQGNTWHQAAVNITPRGRFKILFEGRIGDNAMSDVAFDDISIHRGQCADIITEPTPALHTPVCMFDCNFDNNLCAWKQLLTDVFDWTRQSGPTSTAMTGPSSDHTTGTGYYMYIEGDSATHGDTARLISEECSDVQPQCLQFWYHMYGSSWTMGLTVYLLHGNEAQEVWRMRENQGNTWQKAAVNITPRGEFKILFEGRRGASAMSDVAFDDISLHRGQCADIISRQIPVLHTPVCMFDCNFDNNLCAWKQLLTDVFDWTRHSGPTSTAMTGPSADHTTGTGYYMYIEGDSAAHGDTARLISEECSDVQPQCLQFWYHMYGSSSTMGLTVYLLHGNEAQEVWRMRENQGNTWHQAAVNITPRGRFKILFEGRIGDNAMSDVAFDDISIHRGQCAGIITEPTPALHTPVCMFDCNFDNNLCTWKQLLTDVFDWTRHSGPTSTAMTGPSSDHTTGTGYYMYIEGDSAAHGDTARLISEECSDVQPQCLEFWYHMYGSSWTMGLTVYLLHGNEAQEVWRKRENQGNTWQKAAVNITPRGEFKILFEGRRGASVMSDVAFDDISIHRGQCADIIPRQIPVLHTPVCMFDCNFDNNLCAWKQLLTDVFDWTRHSGPTSTIMTGPSSDHTTGTGYYMYIEGDSAAHGDTARLISEECSDVQPQCLQFWYHMYGSSWTMGLTVYLLHGNEAQEVWRKRENQGNTWHQAAVNITPRGRFKILFEGRIGDNAMSDVAFDDISIHRGQCADIITAPTPALHTPVCMFDCNFDNNFCTWKQLLTDVFDWTRHSGPTSTAMTGPSSDHTTGTGYYMYIEGDSAAHGDTARLISEECSDVQPQCLEFWYHMYGSSWTMGLTVYLLHGNEAQEVWRMRENQGNTWQKAAVNITPRGEFKILFEGRRGASAMSDVAFDDISIHRGQCADIISRQIPVLHTPVCMFDCNFDNNLCAWKQLLTDVFDWTRHSGPTSTAMTGPSADHTTGTGYYMYIEGDSAAHGDTARLISEECSDVQPQCLQFWYHMYGSSSTMGLTVYLLHGNEAQEVWRKRENQGNTWHQAAVNITPRGRFKILFEGRIGDNAMSDVAFDDISIHRGQCAGIITEPTPALHTPVCMFDCNFDNNLCTWKQLLTDVFDWTRHSGPTSTAMTGPSSDHTTGTGYYMYIEGDSAAHGDTARLISEECSDVQPQCLEFWYHMYGSSWTMGLTVYLLHGNEAQEVWRKRENQGNTWQKAAVNITPRGEFKILFEGRRGASVMSDVAFDDISIHRGQCADIIPRQIPVLHTPVCMFDCNFDNNLCAWKQLLTDVFDWTRHSGPTSTAMTGPSSDHTTGTGYYMYIEGDSAAHGDTARLISEECSDVQPQCLQFWYHMYGSSWTMGLTVYLLHGNEAQEVWRKRENQGNTWHQAAVNITPRGRFKILFEGRIGDNAMSDVAFDDISIHRGQCADIITEPTPALHTPVCMFDCNFDNNLCTWKQLLTDVFDWTRQSGPTSTAMTGPSSDHTTGTGYYMYIEGDSAAHGDTARLISEECSDVQPQCLEFWYHMYGSSWTMGLTVYLLHGNEAQEVWRMRENQGNTWQKAAVNITPRGEFKILFEGRRGASAMSDVAFDDISIHRGQCADIITEPTPVLHTPVCIFDCNFDNNLCAWKQLLTDVFDWTRHSGPTSTAMTGPSSDHTTGTGYYLYIEGDSAAHGDTARLISEECSDVQPQCLEFWYHMYGSSWTMGLTVYLVHGNEAQEVWRKRENQGNTWQKAAVNITPHGRFKILFEGRRGASAMSDVAFDDISLHRGQCADIIPRQIPVLHTPVCMFDCNFDNNLCAWKQLLTDVFDWTRHSGPTSTAMTGPSSDHTTGTGYYMYIEGDSATHGDTARLISEECSDVQPQCLQFWYHMYGSSSTMGLTVYLLHGNEAQEVWRKRENQGNTWHQAAVNITPRGRFKILFEGRIGDTAMSDVAFDDISIHRGQCPDFIIEPPPTCMLDCNFDLDNLCSWNQLRTDAFDWTRHSGPTSTSMTGPSSDHTTGTGYYLYIEGDSAAHGDTARLISEECSDVQPQCLQFWYHMYGSSWTMGLTVYLVHGNEAQEVWTQRENQGNIWRQALVPITPHGRFTILFEGRRGHSARSDVAVDDVSLHRGSCADLMVASSTPDNIQQ